MADQDVPRIGGTEPIPRMNRVRHIGPAEPADAVAILRAGLREDVDAVQGIVSHVDPIQLAMHLAYLADLFGKAAYGGPDGLDEALALWQSGDRLDPPA